MNVCVTGGILYSTQGARVADLSTMPEWLIQDVATRLPSYEHAPTTFNKEVPNETSLTYFQKHFEEYLNDVIFPIATVDDAH